MMKGFAVLKGLEGVKTHQHREGCTTPGSCYWYTHHLILLLPGIVKIFPRHCKNLRSSSCGTVKLFALEFSFAAASSTTSMPLNVGLPSSGVARNEPSYTTSAICRSGSLLSVKIFLTASAR